MSGLKSLKDVMQWDELADERLASNRTKLLTNSASLVKLSSTNFRDTQAC
jgi:hypothetical protein